jgi:hypothetical protein
MVVECERTEVSYLQAAILMQMETDVITVTVSQKLSKINL